MKFLEIFTHANFWFTVIRAMTPIVLVALAALMSTRCGIMNMALEGIMLFSALFAVIASAMFQSVIAGIIAAIITGIIFSLMLAYFKLKLKADELLTSIAINLLATGMTVFILYLVSGSKANSAFLQSKTIPTVKLDFLKSVPFLHDIFSNHSILVYVALILVVIVHYLLFKTPLGLRIRSVGSNEHAAESVGVYVNKTRYISMVISGVLVGLAGAYMSMSYMTMFVVNMTSGRGFIGLASANIGGRTPFGALIAALLFGFFESLGHNLQKFAIAPDLIFMIPYFAIIIMYTAFTYRSINRKKRQAKKLLAENND